MPLHDWTRVPSGLFHDFHQSWSIRLKDSLNSGRLPKGISALVEHRSGPLESDVLAIESRRQPPKLGAAGNGGMATLARPAARHMRRSTKEFYADRANRVVVKHHLGQTIAVIEIVSPGNKSSRTALRDFVEKSVEFLKEGVHVLVVDLFPPGSADPAGIHTAIWNEIDEEDFRPPPGKDRILASYETGSERVAYVETVGLGDPLPDMPLFLASGFHVPVPLETTYEATWNASPEDLRTAVETGELPQPEGE